MRRLFISLVAVLALVSCAPKTEYARFDKDTYYVGTNFWYGAILASEGQGGDRARLARELDAMQALGINNLRVLVGADGMPGVEAKVEPVLQYEPGVYNDTILDGLDYLMAELGKRHMYAVLFINNSWEWSGGYSQYLSWAKNMHWPTPQEVGYPTYMASCAEWSRCKEAQELYFNHLRFIVGRTNRYTGLPYKEDPAIFSWQIGNEPRAFSMDVAAEFTAWIGESARLIRSLDPNHMISTGSEGIWGCEGSEELTEAIHAFPEISYVTCHIWPFNWSWMDPEDKEGTIDQAIAKSNEYIAKHLEICQKLDKPLVIEEFGFPRDIATWADGTCRMGTPTHFRDLYYRSVFENIVAAKHDGGYLHGCNFWGWGGEAIPQHQQWQAGDPYTGDPAQEDQGLNSVFNCDTTTIQLIEEIHAKL